MVIIKCTNQKCTAPNHEFDWDERESLESDGKIAKKGDPGAVSFVIECSYCGTKNKIWLVKVKYPDPTVKGFTNE